MVSLLVSCAAFLLTDYASGKGVCGSTMQEPTVFARSQLDRWTRAVIEAIDHDAPFELLAQQLCATFYVMFSRSVVLVRAYLTVPFSSLPEHAGAWVQQLAEADVIGGELRDSAPVISLVGTAGRQAAWNCRLDSREHVGFPLFSSALGDRAPLLALLAHDARTIASLRNEGKPSHSPQAAKACRFVYTPDAAAGVEAKGRTLPLAPDFVADNGIATAFGLAAELEQGQSFYLVVFCSHSVTLDEVLQVGKALLHLKAHATHHMQAVFLDVDKPPVSQTRLLLQSR